MGTRKKPLENVDKTFRHVSRGASGYEKLVTCENCQKLYRSSNMSRHKRSCLSKQKKKKTRLIKSLNSMVDDCEEEGRKGMP